MPWSPGDPGVPCEQRRAQDLRQRDVDGIVGGQVLPQAPDPGQKKVVGVALNGKISEIFEDLAGAVRGHLALPHEAAEDLGGFDIQKMGRVERNPGLEQALS